MKNVIVTNLSKYSNFKTLDKTLIVGKTQLKQVTGGGCCDLGNGECAGACWGDSHLSGSTYDWLKLSVEILIELAK